MGSNTNISIENLAKKIMKVTRTNLNFKKNKKIIRPILSEVDNLKCDNHLIQNLTKWRPKTNLDQGLKKTIEWIKDNYEEYSDKYEI